MNRWISLLLAIALCVFLPVSAAAQADTISTFAGGGPNNLPATLANIDGPTSVAVSADGNTIYVAARSQHCIFKVSSGTLTIVAGNGTPGYNGDNILATSALLYYPTGLALDGSGNLYISDTTNERIRRIDKTTGIITTVAGAGSYGFSGDGGPATAAQFARPQGIAVDSLNNLLYVADIDNERIRKVDLTSGTITTVAGNGTAGYSGDGGPAIIASLNNPTGVAVDSLGNLYIADGDNFRVRRVDTSGVITTFAGNGINGFAGNGGPATSAELSGGLGLAVDTTDNLLLIADTYNLAVRGVNFSSTIINTVAGGPANVAGVTLGTTQAVSADTAGDWVIADTGHGLIRLVPAATRTSSTVAGNGLGVSGDTFPAVDASLNSPRSVAVDSAGNVFIADTDNQRIRRVDAASKVITTVAGNGNLNFSGDNGPATSAELANPLGIAVDASGYLFIADTQNQRIRRVDAATQNIITVAGNGCAGYGVSGLNCGTTNDPAAEDGVPATNASLNFPQSVAVDGARNLYYIADLGNQRIRRVGAVTQIITTVAGNGCAGYAFSGTPCVSDPSAGDGALATAASLSSPTGVALDASGNLYIADQNNQRIRKVDAMTQIITTVAGTGTMGFNGDGLSATSANLNYPSGVAVDLSGNLYIADIFNQRIRRVDAVSGTITTVAGDGSPGSLGDTGAATAAELASPPSVAVNLTTGNLYIADMLNNRVRLVTNPTVAPMALSTTTLTFPDQVVGTTSAAQTVTLSNTGSGPMTITEIQVGGDYTQTNDCGASVAAGASCTISVLFFPTPTGAWTTTLSIAANAGNSPQIVSVSGNGINANPIVVLSPSSLTFSSQPVATPSAAQTVSLTNTGNAALNIVGVSVVGDASGDYTQTNNCGTSVAAGASCLFNVTFTPAYPGTRTAAIAITDDASTSPQTIALAGTGTGPYASLSLFSLQFGTMALLSTSSPQTTILTNVGNAPLTITGISATGDFAETNTCGSPLAESASCTISVTFTPKAPGLRTGTLALADNAPGSPQSVSLSGTGQGPVVSLSGASLAFGDELVGTTSSSQTVTLANTGNGPLTITNISTTGSFPQTNSCGTTVAASASCTITVSFAPGATGQASGMLTISDNAADSPQTVSLTGTGTAPGVQLSPTSLTLTQLVGQTTIPPSLVNLTNTGTASLNITSITLTGPASGDYAQTNNCGSVVGAGTGCAISISFTPSAAGTRSAALTITDNAADSPQTVTLTGTGRDFSLSASPTSSTVGAGQTATYTLQVTPGGGFDQAVSFSCDGAPSAATCIILPGSVTLDGTNAATATVTVTTNPHSLAPPGADSHTKIPIFGWLAALGALLCLAAFRRRRARLVLAALVLLVAIWTACGGGETRVLLGTPPGTYTLKVTATSGGLTHQVTLTLGVN